MNHAQPLTAVSDDFNPLMTMDVEEASRLALTALTADLEDWARDAAIDGLVLLSELIDVLHLTREACQPATVDGVLAVGSPNGGGLVAVA